MGLGQRVRLATTKRWYTMYVLRSKTSQTSGKNRFFCRESASTNENAHNLTHEEVVPTEWRPLALPPYDVNLPPA